MEARRNNETFAKARPLLTNGNEGMKNLCTKQKSERKSSLKFCWSHLRGFIENYSSLGIEALNKLLIAMNFTYPELKQAEV